MTAAEYKKTLRQLISYIRGNRVAIVREIEKNMKNAAHGQQFEQAAYYRNQLMNLQGLQRQTVFGRDEFLDISKDEGLIGLRDLLGLPNIPRRIEAYDVSHHGGTNNVASMVVFTNGVPDKAQYRKFKLRTGGSDDLAQMRETITRRLKHLKDWGRPDLVVIDGGQTQLGAIADLLNVEEIPFVGRNKSGDHTRNATVNLVIARSATTKQSSTIQNKPGLLPPDQVRGRNDRVHETIQLDNNSHIAKLIARIDDEAHRFAVSYHTSLKRAGATKSALEGVPGVGPATRKKLVRKFGSVVGVKKASEADLAAIIGPAKAKTIKQKLG